MINLAGKEDCDKYIENELRRCGIGIIKGEKTGSEVPYSITGKLGTFTFRRAWYYWIVEGNVPLLIAQELYADPVGKEDVRVSGNCACPPPEEWVTWLADNGKEVVPMEHKEEFDRMASKGILPANIADAYIFTDEPTTAGKAYITGYHIDSEVGLRLFADTLKKHGLVAPQESK